MALTNIFSYLHAQKSHKTVLKRNFEKPQKFCRCELNE